MMDVEILNGKNIIDIIFDDFASCLVVQNPLAVDWPDCTGSVARYFSISDLPNDQRASHVKMIDKAMAEGTDEEQMDAVKEFLNLFANGKYSISKYDVKHGTVQVYTNHQIVYADSVPQNERFSGYYYDGYSGNNISLISSQSPDKIDKDRVEYYCKLIERGARPTVLIFCVYNASTSTYSSTYVLDGHHKLEAYLKMEADIPLINIVKTEDCVNKTAALLINSHLVLKDFEFQHLFENNDYLQTLNFVENEQLTSFLDSYLVNSNRVDLCVLLTLRNYSGSKTDAERAWLNSRIQALKKNKNVNFWGTASGLWVYRSKINEGKNEYWYKVGVKSNLELRSWIKKYLKVN
jgi:hypothetical protein